MTAAALLGYAMVPLFGALMCTAPLVTRPTVQFGVRIPPARVGAAVIREQRRGYRWRTGVVAIAACAALLVLGGGRTWWPSRLDLVGEMTLDLGCFWRCRRRIMAVKVAEAWFAGRRQTIVTDTSWRTSPPRFPYWWLLPAAVVIMATLIIDTHRPAVVLGQAYVTVVWTGVLLLIHRARPDLDAGAPAAGLHAHRTVLAAFTRGGLLLIAGADASLLLDGALGGPPGLILLPFVLGLSALLVGAVHAGRLRTRTFAEPTATDRDDDRFWKAGLLYVNRADPAVLVASRFGVGWTVNLGNPVAWLIVAAIVALPAVLVVVKLL